MTRSWPGVVISAFGLPEFPEGDLINVGSPAFERVVGATPPISPLRPILACLLSERILAQPAILHSLLGVFLWGLRITQ